MSKQKKDDAGKVKFRPGKSLPKGGNETDTSFKTKQIVTPDQFRANPSDVSLKDLLNQLEHKSVSSKIETLHKLKNFVKEKEECLSLLFPDVLNKLGSILRQSDAGVREVAIDVMKTCLNQLSDVQLSCFSKPLTLHLTSMMTHNLPAVQTDALKFLAVILENRSNAICHSVKVPSHLLNLISSRVPENNQSKGVKRKLCENIGKSKTSQEWRAEVLKHIYTCLQCALKMESEYENKNEDECEVYWDAEKPLYLPLYSCGSSTLVPFKSPNSKFDLKSANSKDFKDFICELIPLLSEVINGEISCKQSLVGTLVELSVVEHLNTVVKILCCLGEWYRNSNSPVFEGGEFTKLLPSIICKQLWKCFPYVHHDSYNQTKVQTKSEFNCMELNLGLCYLYCMFVLDTDSASAEIEDAINAYLDEVFRVCITMCDKSIGLMLKLSKIYIVSTGVHATYKNAVLLGLYGILQANKSTSLVKNVYSFFMDVSLNYDFKYLLDTEGMETWFKVILKEVVYMMKSGVVDKKFLKYIRQICTRKYSYFLELLNNEHENLIVLLKYDNEEFQLTIIHLICSLNQPYDLFQDLVELLSDPSFSLKTATRTIHQLHSRFLGQNVLAKEKILFLQFLLNLAFDTPFLNNPSWESSEKSSDLLRTVLESCHFEIRPSSKWERHLKLTKICFECLPPYMQIEPFAESTILFIKTILLENTKLPIHCVVALLKFRKEAYDMYQDEDVVQCYSELIFSSMMYLSVMHNGYKKEGMESYAILELHESLQLEREDVSDIISIINNNIYNFGENEVCHALRVALFMIHENILRLEDRLPFFEMLEKINTTWQRSKLVHPLWLDLCKFFQFI